MRNLFMKTASSCVLAFMVVLASFVFVVVGFASTAEATPVGSPLYAWGQGSPAPAHTPTRIGTDYWIASATSSGGYFAINQDGYLHAWGAAGDAD